MLRLTVEVPLSFAMWRTASLFLPKGTCISFAQMVTERADNRNQFRITDFIAFWTNVPANRRTGRVNCNHDALAGFAAAHRHGFLSDGLFVSAAICCLAFSISTIL